MRKSKFSCFVYIGKSPKTHAFIDSVLLSVVRYLLDNTLPYLLNISNRLTLMFNRSHARDL